MTKPDLKLEEAAVEAIAERLTGGQVLVLKRRDLAKRAALEGFKQALALAEKVVAQMAIDHELAGDTNGAAALREAVIQIRISPSDLQE